MPISEYSDPNATATRLLWSDVAREYQPTTEIVAVIALPLDAANKPPGEEEPAIKLFADLNADLSSPLEVGNRIRVEGFGDYRVYSSQAITNEGEDVAIVVAIEAPRLRPLVIHRPGGQVLNPDGTPQRDANDEIIISPPSEIPAMGRIRPFSARELTEGRQTLLVDAEGILERGTDVRGEDEIAYGGRRYRVIGVYGIEGYSGEPEGIHVDLRSVV